MWTLTLIPLVLLTYANVYGNAFLFDDEFLILRNQYLDSFANLGRIFTSSSTAGAGFADSFYRPMQGLCYLVINQIFGRDPAAFHAINVGLHLVNTFLIYRLGRLLGLGPWAGYLAAALWAVHPLHVEAVTYQSATADPLHALFVLAALNVAAPRFTGPRVWAAAGFGLCGMLAKESAIVMAALLSVTLFALDGRRWAWRTYLRTWPAWATALGYYVLRRWWLNFDDAHAFFKTANTYADQPLTRLYTALAALPSYVELLVWPHDLHMDRDFPTFADPWHAPVLLGLAMVIAAVILIARAQARPRLTLAAAGALWFGASHLPHSGVLIPVNSVFLEHWMYLTAAPVFLGAGAWLSTARVGRVLAGLAVLALAQKTFRQNEVWATPSRFFSHTLEKNPRSARIRHNLAIALSAEGDDARALEQYELMIAAGTPYPQTFHNAGLIYLKRGDDRRAEDLLRRALALNPKFYPSAQSLVELYDRRGDARRSREYRDLYRSLAP